MKALNPISLMLIDLNYEGDERTKQVINRINKDLENNIR